jgi:hypothetical protein
LPHIVGDLIALGAKESFNLPDSMVKAKNLGCTCHILLGT